MPQDTNPTALMPSVLDRLLDPQSLGTSARPWYGLEQLTRVVRRDLVALLNSRQTHGDTLDDYPECSRSLLGFGLPDLSSLDAFTKEQRAAIGQRIEQVIRLFEPRLSDVQVKVATRPDSQDRTIHFLVDARLHTDSAPDVAFEVILELATGQYDVELGNA